MNKFSMLLLLISGLVSFVAGAQQCTAGPKFICPNCGGYSVKDCFKCDGFVSTDTKNNICFDRRLFSKYNDNPDDPEDYYIYWWNDIVGAVVWFFMAGVAISCGVGGGGIFVPLGILLLQFSPKQSSGISQASIFGSSLGGLFLNSQDKFPDVTTDAPGVRDKYGRPYKAEGKAFTGSSTSKEYTRPLIDYNMALYLAPMELMGSILGVIIQTLLPNWLYLMLAGIVLSYTAYRTFGKYKTVREKELQVVEEAEQESVEEDSGSEVFSEDYEAGKKTNGASTLVPSPLVDEEGEADGVLRRQYLEEDMRQFPRDKIATLIVLWIGLFILTLFRGGKGVDSLIGITCESPWYAVLIVVQYLWCGTFAAVGGMKLLSEQKKRVAVRYPYQTYDVVWNTKALGMFGGGTFFAGVIAGLIGIGGGMILGPMMLLMGVNPRISTSTTATLIALTSSSVAVSFVIGGIVPWSYALYFFLVCLCGALCLKRKIDAYVKRTGRASLLIFVLACIILFATVGCIFLMLQRLAQKDWCFDGMNKFCTVSKNGGCPDRMLEELEETPFWEL